MSRAAVEVRPATTDDGPGLAAVLARAFSNEPSMSWIFRDAATRTGDLEHLFLAGLERIFLPHGASFTTADLAGVAVWAPPKKWKTPDEVVEEIAPAMAERFTPDDLGRLLTFVAITEAHHPDDVDHWYLAILGVDTDRQGGGVGSACMRPILERADAEGTPAYLETSNERNLPLYERNGFRVTGVVDLPDDGPPIYSMWRQPALREGTRGP